MNIANAPPPNFAAIAAAFPVHGKAILYCYGDTIFNPSGIVIPPELIVHEAVHSKQQGRHPDLWWDSYISSPKFRLEQEIPAHQAEWAFVRADPRRNRQQRRAFLAQISGRLASPLYGRLLSKTDAKRLIETRAAQQ